MADGVFRRRHDYRQPRRLVLAVAVVAASAGQTLAPKRPLQRQEPSRVYYQRRQVLPTVPAFDAVGEPLHLPKLRPQARLFERQWDYRLRQRLPTVPAADLVGEPLHRRQRPPLPPPRPWDYRLRQRLPGSVAVAPTFGPVHRPKRAPFVVPVRFEVYQPRQALLNVPAFVPIPGGGLVRPKRVFLDMYVRPWDYARGSGRNTVFRPMLPGVVTPPPPPSEVSRGIYAGPRGLYHEERSSAAEPYCAANTENAQVIPTATPTLLNIIGTLSFAGNFDEDPWGMIDVANDRIVFTHDGWYSVTVAVGSFAATSGTEILLEMNLYNAAGLEIRDVIKFNRASTVSGVNSFHLSTLEPFVRGYYLQTYVTQSSGTNKAAGPFRIYLARVATRTTVVPI